MKNNKSILKKAIGIICIAVQFGMLASHAQVIVTTNVTDVTCNGNADGSITAIAGGGTAPYQYSIDGGVTYQTSGLFSSLSAGTYQVWAMDALSQTGSTSVMIAEPTSLQMNLLTVNATCGNANGSITAVANGGTSPYQFSIGGPYQASGSFNGLVAGNYTVTVIDNNGCIQTQVAAINNNTGLILSPIPDVSICLGTYVAVCPIAFGGTPPFTYQLAINGTPVTGFIPCDSFSVTVNSTFVITATDANGCIATDAFNITVNPLPVLGLQNNVLACNFPVSICIPSVTGGAPFTYTWTTADTTQCINAVASGTYAYTVTNVFGCTVSSNIGVIYTPGWQGIDISINSLPVCGQCNGSLTATVFGGAGGPVTYLWSNGITVPSNNFACDNQNGFVMITDTNNCVDTAFYNLNCYSVWPGDANNDGVANNVDLLPIGIGYGTLDIVRPNATINWQAENCLSWADTLANGTNYKHIDCNGDGIIADDDTIAILQNFGLIHPRLMPRIQNITDPPLYFDIVVDTVGTSQQLDIPLFFGTTQIPADSIYGMAFTVNYDNTLVQGDSIAISFTNSWLGAVGSNLIYIAKNDSLSGKLYVGVTRIDQNDTSGFGEMARVTVVTTDNVSGRLSQPTYDTLYFGLSDVTIINKDEIPSGAYLSGDSIIIEDLTAFNNLYAIAKQIFVFPNPAKERAFIKSTGNILIDGVEVTDVSGKTINQENKNQNALIKQFSEKEFLLNTKLLQSGIYLIKIKTESGLVVKKITVVN